MQASWSIAASPNRRPGASSFTAPASLALVHQFVVLAIAVRSAVGSAPTGLKGDLLDILALLPIDPKDRSRHPQQPPVPQVLHASPSPSHGPKRASQKILVFGPRQLLRFLHFLLNLGDLASDTLVDELIGLRLHGRGLHSESRDAQSKQSSSGLVVRLLSSFGNL